MPSFKEQYDQLFGPSDPYDPIDVGPFGEAKPRRSALPMSPDDLGGIEAPTADPLLEDIRSRTGTFRTAAPDDDVEWADYAKLLGAKAVATGEMGLGALEYAGRQAAGKPGTVRHEIVQDLTNVLSGARESTAGFREDIMQTITPEAQSRVAREFLNLDPNRTIWQGSPMEVASSVALKFTAALPATILTLLPAARFFKAGASTKALTYLGASEGGLSLGGIANGIADEVNSMTSEQLLQESPLYAQLLEEHGDEQTARDELIRQAQGLAPVVGGAMVAAVSITAGRYLEPVFTGAGSRLAGRAGRGFAAEAAQEAPQSGVEQFVQNYAARAFDADRQLSEGVAEAVVEGGVVGGLIGGGFSAAFGKRPEPPPPPPIVEEGGQRPLPGFGARQTVPDEELPPEPEITPEIAARAQAEGVIFTEQQRPLDLQQPVTDVVPYTGREPDQVRGPTGGQPTLPLETRRRGQAPDVLTELPRGYEPPSTLPPLEPEPVAEQEGVTVEPGDRAAIRARMRDLLDRTAEPAAAPQAATQADLPTRTAEGHLVRMFDESGQLIDEDVFETTEEASERADTLAKEFPDARITVVPMREQQGAPKKARLSTTKQVAQPDVEAAPPASAEEQAAERIRAALPFEERIEPISKVRGAPSLEAAADRLVGEAAAARESEEVRRIGGFYSPDQYEFNSPEREQEYRDAWSKLIDAELTIEMSGQKQAVERAKKRRTALLKELGTARQLDKPKRKPLKSERLATAATAVDKDNVRKLKRLREGKTFERTEADEDVIGELPDRISEEQFERAVVRGDDGKVTALTREGEVLFEQAVRSFAARKQKMTFPTERERGERQGATLAPEEVASNVSQLTEQARNLYATPGRKVKFIKRELGYVARRVESQKSVKAVEITKTAATTKGTSQPRTKSTLKSAPLTVETATYDESVSDKVKRKERVKTARASLRKSVTKANNFIQRFQTPKFQAYLAAQRDPDTKKLSKEGADYLYAKQYLAQLTQFAESMLKVEHTDKSAIELLEGLDKMLGALEGLSVENFATKWAKLARANEFDRIAEIPDSAIAALRDPDKRRKVTEKSIRERMNSAARMRRIEEQWKDDSIFNEFVGPVLRKASQSVYDTVNEVGRGAYIPTWQEISGLRLAMNSYRRYANPEYMDDFYKPIRKELEYLGFEFDEKGDLIEQYTPSDEYLGPGYRAKYGEPPSADTGSLAQTAGGEIIAPDPVVERDVVLRARSEQDVQDQRAAVVKLDRANALIENFKEKVAPSKTTINGIKRAEQRMIRGLRKLGVWTDVSPGLGRISIGGYVSKTYRLVGPRLDARKLSKPDAKTFVSKVATFATPRELSTVAQRMRGSEVYTSNVEGFIGENELELFMESVKPVVYDAQYVESVQEIGDKLIGGGTVNANEALRSILRHSPEDSFYSKLANKLNVLDLTDVEVAYGHESDFEGGELGKFRPKDNIILLNRDALADAMVAGDQTFGARVVHVLTHEAMHAATHNAIRNNGRLREYFVALRAAARDEWMRRNPGVPSSKAPYGLKVLTADKVIPVDEFVVEAYSNPEFQEFLRSIEVDKKTLWSRILDFIRALIGWTDLSQIPDSMLDAVMIAEDILFEGAGVAASRPTGDFALESYDQPLRDVANGVWSRVSQGGQMWQRVRDSLADKSRFLMTMDQLHRTYERFFVDGSMARYVDAFKRRNAMNSELMKLPQKLSREWTALEENTPEQAREMSRVATEATLHNISAALPITDKVNAHLTDDAEIAKHKELHDRFNAMSPEAQTLYRRVSKYYRTAIKAESLLLMQNALRGILTQGEGTRMTRDEFAAKFDAETMKQLTSREAIEEVLKDHVPDDELDRVVETVHKMSSLPEQQKGDYFPLMRYGDFVVFAERKHDKQIFEDRKEAWAERKRLVAGDPTLDVGVYKAKDGKYVLQVIEREFIMAESISEAEQERARLIEQYGEEFVGDVMRKFDKRINETAIESNAGLNSILKTLAAHPAAQAAIKNHYLRSLADSSFRKHEVKRKKRRGVNFDQQHRNFVNYAKQAAYYTAQLKFGWRMGEALREMEEFVKTRKQHEVDPSLRHVTTEQLSGVVNQVHYRDQMTHDPIELNKLVRKGVETTQFMMLTSPSYWMINASQPWLVTAPVMGARFGMGQAVAAMAHAQSLVKTPLSREAMTSWGGVKALGSRQAAEKAFDVIEQLYDHLRSRTENGQDYIDMIEELRKQHIMDVSVLTELREIAQGVEGGAWARVLDASRIMSHITEVNNRVVTAIAAFDLEMARQMQAGATREDALKAATEYAGDMVSDTQFNYSTANKPPLFQSGGPLKWAAPLMFQFMQWPQHMYALLIRNFAAAVGRGTIPKAEARKAVLGLLTTHAAVGGMVGMMLQPIKWAFGMAMFAFGDDDEPYTFASAVNGRTFDNMVQKVSVDLFGNDIGAVLSKGLPQAMGIDLSSRMSMGTLYFVDLRGDNAESVMGSLVASFGGATLNQVMNWGNAAGRMFQGDIFRGIEQASPKIARDALRSVRYYNDGLVNNAGDTVIQAKDIGFGEIFAQSLGLQPAQVSNFYEAQSAIKSAETYARDRKDSLVKRFRMADTAADRREVLREVAEFNRSNPAFRITRSTLIRGVASKREREVRYRRYGANVDDQSAAQFSRYGEPYQE